MNIAALHALPGWRKQAACKGRTHLFFGAIQERPPAAANREAKARAICQTCPVIEQCRRWARRQREYGFWGGESELERARAGYAPAMPIGSVARVATQQRRAAR